MKEIVVISGGSHKGIVKVNSVEDSKNMVSVTCKLDFYPKDAVLYLVGDNIAKSTLNDINTTFEVSFCASSGFGCVLRTPNVTMLGGHMQKAVMLKRVDEYLKGDTRVKSNNCERKPDINSLQNKVEYACKNSGEIKTCDAKNFKSKNQLKNVGKKDSDFEQKTLINNSEILSQKDEGENDNNSIENIDVETTARLAGMKDITEWVKYDGNNFYYAVKPQLDELFVCYPIDEELNNHVPHSSWVHVDVEDGYYVVGILYEYDDKEPTHICYGVPAYVNSRPPQELAKYAVWLPVTEERGYWTIFQSAHDGQISCNI